MGPDRVSVRHWFAFYVLFLLLCGVPLAILVAGQPWTWSQWAQVFRDLPFLHGSRPPPEGTWSQWAQQFGDTFRDTDVKVKLLAAAIYLSMCTTATPLPTGWLVASVATRQAAVGPDVWTTTLIVAAVGAAASTIAHLNDYHLFTWLLRRRRVSHVRDTRLYRAAAPWFHRSPFALLLVFNVVPIPVDVIRLLAITCRYPRLPFAAAGFLGRFIRYAVFAFVTYWWNLGWIAPVALLGLSAVLGAGRIAAPLAVSLLRRTPGPGAAA